MDDATCERLEQRYDANVQTRIDNGSSRKGCETKIVHERDEIRKGGSVTACCFYITMHFDF